MSESYGRWESRFVSEVTVDGWETVRTKKLSTNLSLFVVSKSTLDFVFCGGHEGFAMPTWHLSSPATLLANQFLPRVLSRHRGADRT